MQDTYKWIQTLGRGNYGTVSRIKHLKTKTFYAMKTIDL